jgi:hypothetical protein
VAQVREFGGYVPDINPAYLSLGDAKETTGVVAKGGALTQDDGFARVDSANLPLAAGGSITDISVANPTAVTSANHGLVTGQTIVIAFTDSTPVIDGSRVVTVTGLNTFTVPVNVTVAGTTGAWVRAAAAVVALPEYRDDTDNLFRMVVTTDSVWNLSGGSWTRVAPADAGEAPDSTKDKLVDWTYYNLDDIMVFTNDDDDVFQFDGTNIKYWEPGTGGPTNFKARSVETFADRLNFLNTSESGSEKPFRLHWTSIGPSADMATASVGKGFIDFTELESEGLRVLTLGDAMACYFRKGVALARRTLISTIPYGVEILSTERGLLSTHSIVDLGGGRHFGIFNDGWFFLDSTGRWQEAGIMQIGNRREHKWMRTFYDDLDWSNQDRVVCGFDAANRWVRIAYPSADGTGDPDRVWIYDLLNDRVWKDDYASSGNVNVWGEFADETGGLIYSQATGTYESPGFTDSYAALAAHTQQRRTIHGTTGGVVFRHDPTLDTQDDIAPAVSWVSHETDFGLLSAIKVSDKVWVEYVRQEDPSVLTLRTNSQGNSQEASLNMDQGTEGTVQQEFVGFRLPGNRLGFQFAGTAPVEIHGFQLNYLIQGTERTGTG